MTSTFALIAAIAFAVILVGMPPIAEASGGWYQGGIGSSHRGGHYENPSTGNHYRHHR